MQILYDFQIQVEDIYNKIKFYRNRLIKSYCPFDRRFYENLILNEIEKLIMMKEQFVQNSRETENEREFTIAELAKYDGRFKQTIQSWSNKTISRGYFFGEGY